MRCGSCSRENSKEQLAPKCMKKMYLAKMQGDEKVWIWPQKTLYEA